MEEAPCEVRKVISLPDKKYAFFKKHLMYEYDFLRKNAEQMGFRNGTRQCVLVMGESSEDGVLVDSSGYGYARYTAPFPVPESGVRLCRWDEFSGAGYQG